MKRLIALMIVGAMTFMLSGCGQEAPKPTTEPAAETTAEQPVAAPAEEKSATETPAADTSGTPTQE